MTTTAGPQWRPSYRKADRHSQLLPLALGGRGQILEPCGCLARISQDGQKDVLRWCPDHDGIVLAARFGKLADGQQDLPL